MTIVAVTRVACNTTTGNQDITTTDLGGNTPQAAFFILTGATADETETVDARMGFGAATSTTERWAVCVTSESVAAKSDTRRRMLTDECIALQTVGVAMDCEADFVAFITNGVRINWGDAPAAAYLLTVIFFYGSALSAKADTFQMTGAENSTVDVTTIGFQPDLLLTASHAYSALDVNVNQSYNSHGVVYYDGVSTYTQHCTAFRGSDNTAASQLSIQLVTNRGIGFVDGSGALILSGEFGSFDSSGFSCTLRDGAGVDEYVGVLAIALEGESVDIGTIATRTSAGSQSITAPGFTPQFLLVGQTVCPAIDTAYNNSNANTIGLGAIDADDEYSTSYRDEDAAADMNCHSLAASKSVYITDDSGTPTELWDVGFTSFDANGWTWYYNTAQGTAVYWWYLVIGEAGIAYQRSAADAVGVTDSMTWVVGVYKTLTEAIGVTDTISNVYGAYRTPTDTVGITDTTSTAMNIFKSLTDAVGITDVISTAVGKVISLGI
jgi:hypothetical protein